MAVGTIYPQAWLCSCLGGVEEAKVCNQSTFVGLTYWAATAALHLGAQIGSGFESPFSVCCRRRGAALSVSYRARLNIAPRPGEFFSVWCFVLDQRLYHS